MKRTSRVDLRHHLALLERIRPAFAARFRETLAETSPTLAALLEEINGSQQDRLLVELLRLTVEAFEDRAREDVAVILEGFGYQFGSSGMQLAQISSFCRLLAESIGQELSLASDDELAMRWRDGLEFLERMLLRGALRAAENERGEDGEETHPGRAKGAPSREEIEAQHSSDAYFSRFVEAAPLEAPDLGEHENPAAAHAPGSTFRVSYEGARSIEAGSLETILEVSLRNQIPHICECGGKARCSTCRVVIVEGKENCLPPNGLESRLARLKGFSPEIRLACQTRITGPVTVRRLVLDEQDIGAAAIERGIAATGREMDLALLFADLRGFTPFVDDNLSYDVVHALNRYFGAVCEAIDAHGGFVDKFIGDGIMAMFGLNSETRGIHPAVDAVRGALEMHERMKGVNEYLTRNFGHQFRLGIGIDYGTVVVGKVGFRLKRQYTAIGDVVNVASRLESQTKLHEADLLVTAAVRRHLSKDEFTIGRKHSVRLAGKKKPLVIYEIPHRTADRDGSDDSAGWRSETEAKAEGEEAAPSA